MWVIGREMPRNYTIDEITERILQLDLIQLYLGKIKYNIFEANNLEMYFHKVKDKIEINQPIDLDFIVPNLDYLCVKIRDNELDFLTVLSSKKVKDYLLDKDGSSPYLGKDNWVVYLYVVEYSLLEVVNKDVLLSLENIKRTILIDCFKDIMGTDIYFIDKDKFKLINKFNLLISDITDTTFVCSNNILVLDIMRIRDSLDSIKFVSTDGIVFVDKHGIKGTFRADLNKLDVTEFNIFKLTVFDNLIKVKNHPDYIKLLENKKEMNIILQNMLEVR